MKYKNNALLQTVAISIKGLSKAGIYIKSLGKLTCDNWKKLYVIIHWIKNANYNMTKGKLGDDMRVRILHYQRSIKKYQSAYDKKSNKKGKKLRNRKALRNKIRKLYLKIKGYVDEIHKKSAQFLCENYTNILIPEFKTQPMMSKNRIRQENGRIKKITDKKHATSELKKLKKTIKLSADVKFVLSSQSHYRFKEYLKATAKRYRTNVFEVDESYTSQCCSFCGVLSEQYDKRMKTCTCCGLKIDRDTNGSRNIYVKSICSKTVSESQSGEPQMPYKCITGVV